MKKILIIGQAPPAKKQRYPYDTTLLYDILSWVGISVEYAQDLFDFDAVYDMFPGYTSEGKHKQPSFDQCEDYWERSLREKVLKAEKIIILGNTASMVLNHKFRKENIVKNTIFIPHPSRRNTELIKYHKKEEIILKLNKIIYGN